MTIHTLHVIYRMRGGVSEIVRRLQAAHGDEIVEIGEGPGAVIRAALRAHQVFFHQPTALAVSVALMPILIWKAPRVTLVLHESPDYDACPGPNHLKSRLKASVRKLVVHLAHKIGYQITSVSRYIAEGYGVPATPVSYIHLFSQELLSRHPAPFASRHGTLVFVRPGDTPRALSMILRVCHEVEAGEITVFGDPAECTILTKELRQKVSRTITASHPDRSFIPPPLLLDMLSRCKVFISPYPREGFGLTAFQAMSLGALVLAPCGGGALKEWLPARNFALLAENAGAEDWSQTNLASISVCNHETGRLMLEQSLSTASAR